MRAFFEFLNKRGLSQRRLETELQKWNSVQVLDFVADCAQLLPHTVGKVSSLFYFVANSQLSGGPHPCASLKCRIAHADTLARFAALYADRVLICDPFEPYVGLDHADEFVKSDLANGLYILYYLRPLLETGLVGFSVPELHFCATCYERYIRDKHKVFSERLSKAKAFLEGKYLRETQSFLKSWHGMPIVETMGPGDLVDHSSVARLFNKLPHFLERHLDPKKPHRLSRGELLESGILESRIYPIVNDIALQNWYSNLYGAHYVTDREMDFDLIAAINHSETNIYSKAFMEALSHSVPFIHNTELSKLIKLREKEGESFRVYRDALALTMKSVTSSDVKEIRQAFDDLVRPELNKVDLAIKNSRKLIWGSLKRDLLCGTGFIMIGLFSGLLPRNIGAVVAALGGFKFTSALVDKASKLLQEPTEIRDNKYYFLWKVKKESYRKL